MKKISYILCLSVLTVFTAACEDDLSDEFDEANGKVEKKLLESITVISPDNYYDNRVISFSYYADGKLNSISDGESTNILIYDSDNELQTVTGKGENLNMEDLFHSPFDAFETGKVMEYDENRNPKEIMFLSPRYYYDDGGFYVDYVEYLAEISYDEAPNPYFATMEAGGIIEVLDKVKLNFSSTPQAPELVQAKLLLPMNNASQVIYKNEKQEIELIINAVYEYDEDNYPLSATVTAADVKSSSQRSIKVLYEYRLSN